MQNLKHFQNATNNNNIVDILNTTDYYNAYYIKPRITKDAL